jgi:maltose alpha-D-glucosyltransferase/alpha-amylase
MNKAASDIWWKNAICYCLDVKTYLDSDGDGWGDLRGLIRKLGYLRDLGVGCLWLTPCYPSPMRDDGYDITDYYSVDPRIGTLGDFVELVRTAHDLGLRVVMDLVVNHTSDEHPWFSQACTDEGSRYRDFYLWSRERPADEPPVVFPGEQEETWSWQPEAGAYYFHRYHDFQPDLAFGHPEVHDEIHQIMGFWLQLGVDGFRVDSLPFLIDKPGREDEPLERRHADLRTMRDFLSRRKGDALMLGEANVPLEEQRSFFGQPECPHDESEAQILFDFEVQACLWLALARGCAEPLAKALRGRPTIPDSCTYAVFARHHDELTFEQVLSEEEAGEVRRAFDPEGVGWIYGRGLRRRMASLLDGAQEQVQLAISLVMAMPGMPVLLYGDEVGLGDDLDLPGRLSTRVPMRWSAEPAGGFSTAPQERWVRPPSRRGADARDSVAEQRLDPGSLLSFTRNAMSMRRDCQEIGHGVSRVLDTAEPAALAVESSWLGGRVLTLHNLSDRPVEVGLGEELPDVAPDEVVDLTDPSRRLDLRKPVSLAPFGSCWLRLSEPAQISGSSAGHPAAGA